MFKYKIWQGTIYTFSKLNQSAIKATGNTQITSPHSGLQLQVNDCHWPLGVNTYFKEHIRCVPLIRNNRLNVFSHVHLLSELT